MSDRKKRAERREQQSREVEASQKALRSIAETERLVGDSEKMLRRHRAECDEEDRESDD